MANTWSTIKFAAKLTLSAVIAVFQAIIEVSWGLAGLFLMIGIVREYQINPALITSLSTLQQFVVNNWIWFFIALLLYNTWSRTLALKEDKK